MDTIKGRAIGAQPGQRIVLFAKSDLWCVQPFSTKPFTLINSTFQWEYLLNDWPQRRVIVQPENRGTGIAIATALLMLRELDAEAIVASFPCDHHYSHEAAFWDVIEAGFGVGRGNSDAIVLLGAEATYPETEYGWIEPVEAPADGGRFAPARGRQFWEKPALATAQDLLRRDCLWNTFVTIGRQHVY